VKTLKLIAIVFTLAVVNSGPVYANPEYSLDSNIEVAELSGDASRVAEKKACCAPCLTEDKAAEPSTEVRREYPVREWSGRDR